MKQFQFYIILSFLNLILSITEGNTIPSYISLGFAILFLGFAVLNLIKE